MKCRSIAQGLAVADFNNDGIDDVAVASRGSNKVSILLVGPDGEFSQAVSTIRIGKSYRDIAAGDFNRDGNQDIAVTSGGRDVYVIFGAGDGTFGAIRQIRRCCSGGGITAGDFDLANGDDLVVSNPSNGDISLLLNRGMSDGSFSDEKRITSGKHPEQVITMDVNGDGRPDVVALNTRRGADAAVFLSNNNNLLRTANFITGKRSQQLALGDMDNDGLPDILAGDQGSKEVAILRNQGNGLFDSPINIQFLCDPQVGTSSELCSLRAVAAADFDRDNHTDIAVALSFPGSPAAGQLDNDTVDIAGSLGNFAYQSPFRLDRLGNSIRYLQVGHFTDDDFPDLVIATTRGTSVRILRNDSVFGTPLPTVTRIPTGGGPTPTPTPIGGGCDQKGCACSTNDDCALVPDVLFCSPEGLCCDSPCTGANERCDVSGMEGTCLQVGKLIGDACAIDEECLSSFCTDGFCCNSRCDGSSETCASPAGTCSQSLTPRATATPVTAPATRTPTRTGTPSKKANGESCTGATECSSGFCPAEDGVCCDSACTGADETCSLVSQRGTCVSTGSGLPLGEPCTSADQCTSNFCADGVCCNAACDGANEMCNLSGQAGNCLPTGRGGGQACVADGQCASGLLCSADAVCCNERCDGANQHCNLSGSEGQCQTTSDVPTFTPLPTRTPIERSPTRTFTPRPTQGVIGQIARGGGCAIGGDASGGGASLLLLLPVGWLLTRRESFALRRQRRVRSHRVEDKR